ncbi:hypothetical protein [[Phormidium] sp. LEGE 05292]|uniref:hypothetical protein n=1 Tax=[Phormidium] sp. LEGE 05292 TaxID=767427 RepID=UPI001D1394FB|nr:hypothetical protein [Phormidium sp. LEGE 05292]
MTPANAELIRALTPIFFATIGGVIGIAVLINPQLKEGQWTAGLGLAGTAIAGAAGLAQSSKGESKVLAQKDVQNIKIQDDSTNELSEAK